MIQFSMRLLKFNFELDEAYNIGTSSQIITITIKTIHLMIHLIFITTGALFVVIFPKASLLLMMPLITISLLLPLIPIPTYIKSYFKNINVVIPILYFLNKKKFLIFFIKIYSVVFYTKANTYYALRNFCYGFTCIYQLISHYYFYNNVILHNNFSIMSIFLISLLLFISFCGFYLLVLINISQIVYIIAKHYTPELLDPMLLSTPPGLPS